jgi:hypothetical protein
MMTGTETMNQHTILATRLGDLTVVRNAEAVVGLYFPHHWYMPGPDTAAAVPPAGTDPVHAVWCALPTWRRGSATTPAARNSQSGRPKIMMGKQPFETVVATHGATVLRVCRAVLGGTDADDAWSETFLSAMKAYPDLPADANVEAWLVTIAHRKAIDVTRARARRAIPVAENT